MTMMVRGRPVPDGTRDFRSSRVDGLLARTNALFLLCVVVVAASLTLGGGTRGGFLSDPVLQLIGIPLLLLALWKVLDVDLNPAARMAGRFCLAVAAVPLVQLIPLPPAVWTALPGREAAAETFALLGRDLPWMPMSVAPYETWLSALSLIPPIGLFLGTMLLGYGQRRLLIATVLAIGLVSVFFGLLQVAQGPESPLRFFEITNDSEAVGFFANRNHFAALLYALLLFAAAWAVNAVATGGLGGSIKDYDARVIVMIIGAFTIIVVLLAGQAMARSRAGLGFTIIALLGAFALGVSDRRVGSSATSTRVIAFATALAVIFTVQYALYRIMERFVVDPLQDARLPFAGNTFDAALAYMPFGSGLGTFVPVYGMFEDPADTIANTYVNHAHNDLLELWLTTGVAGPVLLALFLVWLVMRSIDVWRRAPAGAAEIDWSLARAGSLVAFLLVAHSFFDYPLRTGAMMAVMALACALLIEPPAETRSGTARTPPRVRKGRRRGARTIRKEASQPHQPKVGSAAQSLSADNRWGRDVEWPEEWSLDERTNDRGSAREERGKRRDG